MGLFDKLKQQGLDALQQGANALNNFTGNQQSNIPTSPQYSTKPANQPSMSEQNTEKESLYGNYMEQLIEMALADGELTEKEKQVLFKKAEANGIDLDEFEMVLVHKVQLRNLRNMEM